MLSTRALFSFRAHKSMLLCVGALGWAIFAAVPQASALNKFFIPPAGAAGDYDQNETVGPEDYDVWRADFGSTENLAADGNGNGVVDAADYTVWRDNLGLSAAPVGDWEDPNNWQNGGVVVGLPGQFDRATIHANRTANVSSDVGLVGDIRIGDTVDPPGGTVNINAGGKVTSLGEVIMGASNLGQFKQGELNLNGGQLLSYGTVYVAYEPGATETVNIGPGSLLDINANLYGRDGTATINQTGGTVDVQNNVIWGEGGDDDGIGELFITRSEYNLSAGDLIVGNTLAIGGAIEFPAPDSDGRVNVTGGMLTTGDLVFDTYPGEEAILNIEGSGVVRIEQANYSVTDANADIASGFIIGSNLSVSTVVDGTTYTQIVSLGAIIGASAAVPEPSTALLSMAFTAVWILRRRRRVSIDAAPPSRFVVTLD